MNVFVLSTGRCGSATFAKACGHITNYTTGHESRAAFVGESRLRYPDKHIESDNRLSWLLGRLDEQFGADAFYVHLIRERSATASSFHRRWGFKYGIIGAYARSILMSREQSMEVCSDYWDTVNSNIRLFLKDKPRRMSFRLENAQEDFREFWDRIGAQGELGDALKEWEMKHNASAGGHVVDRLGTTE